MSNEPQPIEFSDEKYTEWGVERTRLTHSAGAPFDGEPVLIRLAAGWCEAWWEKGRQQPGELGGESSGFQWVCLDDQFQAEFDEPSHWLPLPKVEKTDDGQPDERQEWRGFDPEC